MAMAISCALARLRRNGLADLPSDLYFEQLCAACGQKWRERLLAPLLTLKLFLLQIVHGNTAINHLRQLSGLSFAAASYCEARARLPLGALQGLLQKLAESASGAGQTIKQGFRVLVVDGTGFSMSDTPELAERFGMPPRQTPGVGYPVCKLMAVLDLASGLLVRTIALPLFTHDMRGIARLHPFLQAGDVLVGDRAFCSVIHLAMLRLRSIHCVFRLHQKRKVHRLGWVRWKRPKACPVWLDKSLMGLLPKFSDVRIIRHVIQQKGYRTRRIYLATTLPQQWSDREVIDLYRRRWEIETCFGHIKTGLKMNVLKCKTVDGVMKELTIYLLVYNLVRLLMLKYAEENGLDMRRISFIDACRLLAAWMLGLNGCEKLILNPDRSGRIQLRRVRRRPKKYPLLKAPRATYKLPELPRKKS
jgi:Transposase DDE domain